jgi:hypothetical protein
LDPPQAGAEQRANNVDRGPIARKACGAVSAAFGPTDSGVGSRGFEPGLPQLQRQLDNVGKAERSHYFDVGVNQILIPGLTVGFDGYYKLARNLIDEGQFGA